MMKIYIRFNNDVRLGKITSIDNVKNRINLYIPRGIREEYTHILVIPLKQGEVEQIEKGIQVEVKLVE